MVITGLMGVGKSTTASALAEATGRGHRDSDTDIQRLFGINGSELATEHGIDELHRIEAAVLLGALACVEPLVISAAAWVVEDARCREALAARAVVVVLQAPLDDVLARIETGDHRRSMDRAELARLASRRAPLFDRVGDLILDARTDTASLVLDIQNETGISTRIG